MRLRKWQRIRSPQDFEQFRRGGTYLDAGYFFLKIKKNAGPTVGPRLAVIVSKRVGDAHCRNRIKRIFREVFRREQNRLKPDCDYLFVARKGIADDSRKIGEKFLKIVGLSVKNFLKIAIDGTAASGKSTTARVLAEKLNLLAVNTGEHYRALTYFFLEKGLSVNDAESIGKELAQLRLSTKVSCHFAFLEIFGFHFSKNQLRSEAVNSAVPFFAKIPKIRAFLKQYQQSLVSFAMQNRFDGIVMEGRDISENILPDANIKVFLTADPDIRAKRRKIAGEEDSVAKRDLIDACQISEGVEVIDTSTLKLNQVVAKIRSLVDVEQHSAGQ